VSVECVGLDFSSQRGSSATFIQRKTCLEYQIQCPCHSFEFVSIQTLLEFNESPQGIWGGYWCPPTLSRVISRKGRRGCAYIHFSSLNLGQGFFSFSLLIIFFYSDYYL